MLIYRMQGQSLTFAPNSVTNFLLQSSLGFIEATFSSQVTGQLMYGILRVNV